MITNALAGDYDVIAHGCNCQNIMGAGIASQIKRAWPDAFLIDKEYGQEFKEPYMMMGTYSKTIQEIGTEDNRRWLYVLNLYTQLYPGLRSPQSDIPFDYDAFTICCKKINHEFQGKRLGVPYIGCGLAGGEKADVESIMEYRMPDIDITIVEFVPNENDKRVIGPVAATRLGNTSSTGEITDGEGTMGTRANPLDGISRRTQYNWPPKRDPDIDKRYGEGRY